MRLRRWMNVVRGALAFTVLAAGVRLRGTPDAPPVWPHSPFGPVVAQAAAADGGRDAAKGNQVELLSGGYDALLVRLHLIRQAQRSISIQTFIWSNDEVGRLVMYELIEAARRGVKVRIIADQMFSDQDPAIVAFLATVHPNLQIKHYRPTLSRIKPSLLHTMAASVRSFHDVNQRMHSKVLLVDDAVLITGGRNVENGYYDHATGLNYRDRDVLVVGPVVREARAEFEQFWSYRHAVASADLTDVAAEIARGRFRRFDTRADYDFGPYFAELVREADDAALIASRFVAPLRPVARAEFLSDEPGKSRGYFGRTARISRELRQVMLQTRTSLVVQTPYLVLSTPARELFRELRARQPRVDLRISTNSFASTDNLIAYSANYRLRNRYVQDLGLEIHEFKPRPAALPRLFPHHAEIEAVARERAAAGDKRARPPFLCVHAKSFVSDDRLAFVGSFNLDPRSQNLNTEVGLLIEDPVIARQLREEIEADLRPDNSWVIARRVLPLRLDVVNELVGGVLSLSPVDVWPIQNTSSFELLPGREPVPPGHPEFHQRYREVGPFPGTDGVLSTKEIMTRLYKAVGAPLTPIL
jgi:phosphatidylserine/phosphatidylglycerophosphate/cardiolipin synthase-like enzyme